MRRDYGPADEWLDAGIAYSREHDLDSWTLYMLGWRARAALERDRWAEATAAAQEVLRHPRSAAHTRILGLLVRALVRLRLGDPDADGPLDEALALARAIGELQRLAPAAAAAAERAWLAGDDGAIDAATADALALAAASGDVLVTGQLEAWRRRAGLPPDAGLRRTAGAREALELAETSRGRRGRHGRSSAAATTPRWRSPRRRWTMRQRATSSSDWRRSARAAPPPASPVACGRAGCAGCRGARPRRGRAASRAASSRCWRCWPTGLAQRGDRRDLVLSPKTVEHHVTAILRKLDTPTRGAAVALAVAQGMVPAREDGGSPR